MVEYDKSVRQYFPCVFSVFYRAFYVGAKQYKMGDQGVFGRVGWLEVHPDFARTDLSVQDSRPGSRLIVEYGASEPGLPFLAIDKKAWSVDRARSTG